MSDEQSPVPQEATQTEDVTLPIESSVQNQIPETATNENTAAPEVVKPAPSAMEMLSDETATVQDGLNSIQTDLSKSASSNNSNSSTNEEKTKQQQEDQEKQEKLNIARSLLGKVNCILLIQNPKNVGQKLQTSIKSNGTDAGTVSEYTITEITDDTVNLTKKENNQEITETYQKRILIVDALKSISLDELKLIGALGIDVSKLKELLEKSAQENGLITADVAESWIDYTLDQIQPIEGLPDKNVDKRSQLKVLKAKISKQFILDPTTLIEIVRLTGAGNITENLNSRLEDVNSRINALEIRLTQEPEAITKSRINDLINQYKDEKKEIEKTKKHFIKKGQAEIPFTQIYTELYNGTGDLKVFQDYFDKANPQNNDSLFSQYLGRQETIKKWRGRGLKTLFGVSALLFLVIGNGMREAK